MSGSVITPAILLRAVNYGEADRVVTLFGRSTGRVSALARAARKSTRRFSGGLGIAAMGEAAIRDRPGADLAILESFAVADPRLGLGADLGRSAHAAYAVELCDKLCAPRQPETGVYDWLDEFLRRLESSGATVERLRVFELGLLRRLGIGPVLDRCTSCARSDLGNEGVRWHPERGGVLCSSCVRTGTPLAADTRRAMARLGGMSLAEAEGFSLGMDVNADCRWTILELIQVHVSGTLKSIEFMKKMGAPS